MLIQCKFSRKAKSPRQTSIIYLVFLIVLFNVFAFKANTPNNPSLTQQPSNYSSSSGMVKVGLTDIPEEENFSLEYFIKERAYLKLLERDILPYLKRKNIKPLTCFISYAWGDRYHEYWVKRFCEMLHKAGIQVLLDRWVVKKGNILNEFVRKIEEVDWVIVVGTKLYLEKYNKRAANSKEKEHVARLEGQLIEHLVRYSTERGNKVIPILLEGTLEESLPFMLRHKISSEFINNDYFEELLKLIHDLYNIDNRDKHFEGIIEKFKKYAIATSAHITEAERKAYEEKRTNKILALDKEIEEEIDLYKEEAFKLAEELAERGDYIEKELNLATSNIVPRLHSYIPQAKLNGYVPRMKEQQELRRKLKEKGICVVYGHGGVGKSTLVAEYGHARKEERVVRWIQAETVEKLLKSYQDLAQELDIDYQALANLTKESIKYLEELTRRIYNALEDRQQLTLLILDNVDDSRIIDVCLLYKPSLVQVIITTRDKKSFKDYNQIELSSFTKAEGKIYIQQRLQDIKPADQDVEALIKGVGLIPQKLALATGYISEISFMNVEKYIAKLQTRKQRGKKRGRGFVLPEVSLGLERLDGLSQLVMRYGVYLDPDFIPLSLVTSLLGIGEEKLIAVLYPLEKLSLITIINGPSKQGVQIHREIQVACKQYQGWKGVSKRTERDIIESVIKELDQVVPDVTEMPDSRWDQARLYASNTAYVLASVTKEVIIHPLLADLFVRMGSYSREVTCDYKLSLVYYEQALEVYQTLYKGNHRYIATTLNSLVEVHYKLGQYQEASKYSKQALEMYQLLYKGNHPDIAVALNNLGDVHYKLGQYLEALRYYQQTLEICHALYEGNHKLIATSLNSLGKIYYRLGQYQEAFKYSKQALEMRQALYSGNHPDIASSLNNLGAVYQDLGQYQEALNYYQQAFGVYQALYKGNHPYIAHSLNNLGLIHGKLGKYAKALKYSKQALEMRQVLYKGNNPYVSYSLENIGYIYQGLGQYQEALKYLNQTLEMKQALYTGNHPDIARSLNEIGDIYQALNQHHEALRYL